MTRMTITLPAKVKAAAERTAKRQGVSLSQFIRESVEREIAERKLFGDHTNGKHKRVDPLFDFDNDVTFSDGSPGDVAENHDKYLAEIEAADYERQKRAWKKPQ